MTSLPSAQRRPTSFDVAHRAQVSRSTVSQILNGLTERFPKETQDRVLRAAAELEYRPSRAGRALVTGTSDLIVLVVPNATFGPHLQDTVDSIAQASAPLGKSVVVRFAGADNAATVDSVIDLRPGAVIDFGVFSQEQRERLRTAGAMVLPDVTPPEGESADPVDAYIGRLQVAELLRSGPRRLVYASLADDRLDPFGPPRQAGIEQEAARLGLPKPAHVSVPLDAAGATAVIADLITHLPGEALGICCYNDDVAIAVCAAARTLRLNITQDISLIGVDRTAIGQLVSPRLSTVHVDDSAIMLSRLQPLSGQRPGADPAATPPPLDLSVIVTLIKGETS